MSDSLPTSEPTPGPAGESAPRQGRRHGRLNTDTLESSLGSVVNLSASGMRIRHHGKWLRGAGEVIPATIQMDQTHLTVKARVVWVKKVGFHKHEVGLEFVELTARQEATLRELAAAAVTNLAITGLQV